MTFTIEPGIYLPGEFGVRIEDVVLINGNGKTEILNKTKRNHNYYLNNSYGFALRFEKNQSIASLFFSTMS